MIIIHRECTKPILQGHSVFTYTEMSLLCVGVWLLSHCVLKSLVCSLLHYSETLELYRWPHLYLAPFWPPLFHASRFRDPRLRPLACLTDTVGILSCCSRLPPWNLLPSREADQEACPCALSTVIFLTSSSVP